MLTLSGIFSDEMKNVVVHIYFFGALFSNFNTISKRLLYWIGGIKYAKGKRGHVQAKRQKTNSNRTASIARKKINENKINRRKVEKDGVREKYSSGAALGEC